MEGLDFVHIHYFLNRILAKRGARTSPSSPPPGSAPDYSFLDRLYKKTNYGHLQCSGLQLAKQLDSREDIVSRLQGGSRISSSLLPSDMGETAIASF